MLSVRLAPLLKVMQRNITIRASVRHLCPWQIVINDTVKANVTDCPEGSGLRSRSELIPVVVIGARYDIPPLAPRFVAGCLG